MADLLCFLLVLDFFVDCSPLLAAYLCAQVYLEGNYAPVIRTPNPHSMRYKDTLSKTQYNAFIVAATIYSIILYVLPA